MNTSIKLVTITLCLAFYSCGSFDSGDQRAFMGSLEEEENAPMEQKTLSLQTVEELPECHDDTNPVFFYIKNEKRFYLCGEDWEPVEVEEVQ